jgi:hypothetical protein
MPDEPKGEYDANIKKARTLDEAFTNKREKPLTFERPPEKKKGE